MSDIFMPQIVNNARIGTPPVVPVRPVTPTPAQAIVQLMRRHPGQLRPLLMVDPRLQAAAEARAADMVRRAYFGHVDPDGYGPNHYARRAGYELPSWYSQKKDGNSIESIASGYRTAEDAFAGWLDSAGHRMHLLGELPFFAEQTFIGVGVVDHTWVVLTAHPSGTV